MKKEVVLSLNEDDIKSLVCEKFNLDITQTKLEFTTKTVGDDRFGETYTTPNGIKVTAQENN